MRKLRQLSAVVVLTLVFATYGFAGIIGTSPEPEPAPAPSSAAATVLLSVIPVLLSVH
jgi:hypothetical protein